MAVHAFNPTKWKSGKVDLCEVKASIVYTASSRTGANATEKPFLEKSNFQII